jgi:nucleotide-binding universal stress UspA family protein
MRVMIATDSSPSSQRVLEEVAARPWPAGTSFCLVNAVDVVGLAEMPVLVEDARKDAEELLRAATQRLASSHSTVESQIILDHPRRAIAAYGAEWKADLILLGSHGHSAIGRFLLGSVAQSVLRAAPCSVEIVRFPPSGAPPSSHPMKILLATDGSACSLAATNSVAGRLWPDGTVFQILSVEQLISLDAPMAGSSLSAIYPASLLEELISDAHHRADSAVEASTKILRHAGLTVATPKEAPVGDPRSVILDTATSWPADLIVVGSHGRRGLDRFLIGSVAESVAVHAHCSVEVIRA